VSISGSGKIGGGDYGNVRISGAGRVNGDLTAEEIRISGSGRVMGSAKAREITVSGSGRFTSDVEADSFQGSGACAVEGSLKAGEFRCSGSQRIGGALTAHYVRCSGTLAVGRNVESDVFNSSGKFNIEGLLSADRVEIRLVGESRVGEIGGEKIEVRGETGFNVQISLTRGFRLGFGGGSLRAKSIEGDEVYLEATRAEVVRGANVRIGPGCRIGRVEYSEALEVHEDAEVKEQVKA
ncbi:MAG: polymer-forming cytoskeletal protein, partial [Candidatus Bipolaricaulota bacterium]